MNQNIRNLLRKPWTLPTATGVAGFGLGTFVGYLFTKNQYDKIELELETIKKDQERIDRVINERERTYNVQISQVAAVAKELREAGEKALKFGDLTVRPQDVQNQIQYYDYTEQAKNVDNELENPEHLAVVKNIFDQAGDEWDYKTEIENRDRSAPYVIHVDEYMGDEMGWDSQSTLTWYEKDQVLTDERDKPIYNHTAVVGDLRFGHGSNDPNVVFIRNEQMQAEYEVLRDMGSYQETVLGEEIESREEEQDLKHSQTRRFRSD